MTSSVLDTIDARLLAEIENLQLSARDTLLGALAGLHRSPRRGSSIEFSEHKLYTPGDDVRRIDWRAYAKTDRYHVKQFEDETNINVELLVDHSGSMEFVSGENPTKLAFARTLAAAIAYLALRQGDAVGLASFASEVTDELPARAASSHLLEVLGRLVRLHGEGPTGVGASIDQFAERSRRRSVVIVLSDLLDPNPGLLDAFRRLAARHHDVAVLHVLDPAELQFPYENPSLFVSMEDSRRLFVHPRPLRSRFVSLMRAFVEQTARVMTEAGIDYHQVMTTEPAAQALAALLKTRERRG